MHFVSYDFPYQNARLQDVFLFPFSMQRLSGIRSPDEFSTYLPGKVTTEEDSTSAEIIMDNRMDLGCIRSNCILLKRPENSRFPPFTPYLE